MKSWQSRPVVVAVVLTALIVAASGGILLSLVRASASSSEIRRESAEALLLADLQASLQASSAHTSDLAIQSTARIGRSSTDRPAISDGSFVAEPHHATVETPGETPPGEHEELSDHTSLVDALAAFDSAVAALRPLSGAEMELIGEMAAAHAAYRVAIADLHALEGVGGDVMTAYHNGIQLQERDLRSMLLELQRVERDELAAAIDRSQQADAMAMWLVPALAGLAIGTAGYLLRLQARRKREEITALHALDRQKDEFIASVSHELRTPLTAVLGFLDLLRSDHEAVSDCERD